MGQCYKACYKAEEGGFWKGFTPWDFGVGAKLMEHSYIGNRFLSDILHRIYLYPMSVVWAGEYADDNIYEDCVKAEFGVNGDYDENKFIYLINETKKVFIDLSKIKKNKYGERIHPLPLLTAIGNGLGGGDYYGTCMEAIGTWAKDTIQVNYTKPNSQYSEVEYDFEESDIY
ncbi:MAG: hypothetical protein MJ237_05985 [bacterium]|nr:hypothetical protein [bacterium]